MAGTCLDGYDALEPREVCSGRQDPEVPLCMLMMRSVKHAAEVGGMKTGRTCAKQDGVKSCLDNTRSMMITSGGQGARHVSRHISVS